MLDPAVTSMPPAGPWKPCICSPFLQVLGRGGWYLTFFFFYLYCFFIIHDSIIHLGIAMFTKALKDVVVCFLQKQMLKGLGVQDVYIGISNYERKGAEVGWGRGRKWTAMQTSQTFLKQVGNSGVYEDHQNILCQANTAGSFFMPCLTCHWIQAVPGRVWPWVKKLSATETHLKDLKLNTGCWLHSLTWAVIS